MGVRRFATCTFAFSSAKSILPYIFYKLRHGATYLISMKSDDIYKCSHHDTRCSTNVLSDTHFPALVSAAVLPWCARFS